MVYSCVGNVFVCVGSPVPTILRIAKKRKRSLAGDFLRVAGDGAAHEQRNEPERGTRQRRAWVELQLPCHLAASVRSVKAPLLHEMAGEAAERRRKLVQAHDDAFGRLPDFHCLQVAGTVVVLHADARSGHGASELLVGGAGYTW